MTHSLAGLDVSRETLEKLSIYADLVRKWTRKINLVSQKSLDQLWDRHIVDSAQVYAAVTPKGGSWVDLGSGGGFPGAVVAILAQELARDVTLTCIESDQRKAAFLRTVSRETSTPFSVLDARIEAVPPQNAQYLSARALAPLAELLGFAERHLAPKGTAIFPKGARHAEELSEARKHWQFEVQEITSLTDAQAVLFKIGAPRRV
ncbi:16S rRNA (guanine(527)-N(7))-methyltransferase RsmG [Fluviibacterium sp. DFM31]|uniref:Ribosomal RNA small subunit methyltransferase G n=1 Tax=Meridianimarinicoccus marinus TaxID=3231483 RepID=A0ABV3L9F9_9RHOB